MKEGMPKNVINHGANLASFKEGFYDGVYFHNGVPQKELSLDNRIALYGVAERDLDIARKLADYLNIGHYPEETLQPHFHNTRIQLEMIRDGKMRRNRS